MIESQKTVSEIIKSKNLDKVGDESEISAIVDKIISENPKIIADIRAGKTQAKGVIIGLAMRETKGRVNPEIINKLLEEKLK